MCDVLIVGAGPVGLFLANECARHGLSYRLIEAKAAQSEHSKALAIMPRTLEIFAMAGLDEPFVAAANRVIGAAISTRGRPLAQLRFEVTESPYAYIAMVPQDVTERLLAESLVARGGRVEYNTRLVGLQQSNDAVAARLESATGASEAASARYVVGCDGAHSAVRHLAEVPFEGSEYPTRFLLADFESNAILPADEMQLCPSAQGPLALFPMSPTRIRAVATVKENMEGEAPSRAQVQGLLDERGPHGLVANAVHWSAFFRIHHRCAARLRSGRVFLAGDAAHIHSPMGGQGMNTGLQDAWNLAWKLKWVLSGLAGDGLLDSYQAERLPIIRKVLETTDRLTRAMSTPSRVLQAVRNLALPALAHLPAFRHAFVKNLSELGVAYPHSPLVEGTGERCWNESLRGGHAIADRFLLFADGGHSEVRQLCADLPDLVELRSTPGESIHLVRPDGYLAGSWRNDVTAARTLLRRQTT